MISETQYGVFRGRKLIQQSGTIGGTKSVFVKLKGIKNELVYPPLGGKIMNPPKGMGFKAFAGDLAWLKYNDNGTSGEIYLLKTYLVHSVTDGGLTVNIVRDGYKHIPFVGDKLGVAPATIGGDMTALTITSVVKTKEDGINVWACGLSDTITADNGDVLVEADSENKMLVKAINGVLDSDIDILDAGSFSEDDFDGARYHYVPAIGGIMYINKMSPIPPCVLALNKANFNGWYQVGNVI